MTFREAIWLPIFIFSEDELESRKMGIGNDDDGFGKTELRAFWSIDFACKESKKDDVTAFFSSGEYFCTPIELEAFVKLINKHLK